MLFVALYNTNQVDWIVILVIIKQSTAQSDAQRKEWLYNESTKPLSDQVDCLATSEHNQLYFN